MKKKTIKKLSTKDIKVLDKKTMNKVIGGADSINVVKDLYTGVCIATETV